MKREVPAILVLAAAAVALPAAVASGGPAPKIEICHNTSSASNPTVVISVSTNALQAHLNNHGDQLFIGGVCGGPGGPGY